MKAMLLDDVDLSDAFRIDRGFSDAPLVDFKSVRCATGYFSDVNKLGEGGFGSVYKVITHNFSLRLLMLMKQVYASRPLTMNSIPVSRALSFFFLCLSGIY